VRIGSKSSGENATIAEIYALALERENIAVERRMNLGSAQSVMATLQRGDIDLYPEYVRTTAKNFRAASAAPDTFELYEAVKSLYERRYGITWFAPSRANESPCVVTSQYAAERYWLLALTKCASLAGNLRLAATSAFVAPRGPLDGLRRLYGGFKFKAVFAFEPGGQYDALGRGDADVADGFTTDAAIAEKQFIVLRDDKQFWPERSVAPVIRVTTMRSRPRIRSILTRISRSLTEYAVQQLNMRRDLFSMEPHDVAEAPRETE